MMTAVSFNEMLAKFNKANAVANTKADAEGGAKQTKSKKVATPAEPVAKEQKTKAKTESTKKATTKSKKTEPKKVAPKTEQPKQIKLAGGVTVELVRPEIASKAKNTQNVLVRFFTECITAEECDEYIKAISGAMTVMKEHKMALKGNSREHVKANVEQFTKTAKTEQPKVEPKAESKKAAPAEPAKAVTQISKITAKVRKDLGLTLERYIKNDGEPSKMFLLKSTSEDGTKALKDLFKSEEFKNLVHYKVWARAYSIPEKHVEQFTKLTGIKAC